MKSHKMPILMQSVCIQFLMRSKQTSMRSKQVHMHLRIAFDFSFVQLAFGFNLFPNPTPSASRETPHQSLVWMFSLSKCKGWTRARRTRGRKTRPRWSPGSEVVAYPLWSSDISGATCATWISICIFMIYFL